MECDDPSTACIQHASDFLESSAETFFFSLSPIRIPLFGQIISGQFYSRAGGSSRLNGHFLSLGDFLGVIAQHVQFCTLNDGEMLKKVEYNL